MEEITRRTFTRNMLGSLLTFSLVSNLAKAEALAPSIKAMVRPWVLDMEQATKAMRAGTISQKEWQKGIEQLLARVDLSDLLHAIDFDTLRKKTVFRASHESVLGIDLPKREGLKADLSFDSFFYAMKKGVSIVPHGHQNMATMHMVLAGEAQALHYDRVASQGDYLIIKPVSDILAKPGHASTVSDESTNIHWFKTVSDTVFMFNIGVFAIDSGKSFTGREYVDPLKGEKTVDGTIRARRLNQEEAYRIYGKF
jgi:hypothetical protein